MLWLLGALLPLRSAQPLTAPPQLPQARVVVVQDKRAMEAFTPRPEVVRGLVERGILAHTGRTNVADAWRSVVKTNDVVGLKVCSGAGHTSGTRPAVVARTMVSSRSSFALRALASATSSWARACCRRVCSVTVWVCSTFRAASLAASVVDARVWALRNSAVRSSVSAPVRTSGA